MIEHPDVAAARERKDKAAAELRAAEHELVAAQRALHEAPGDDEKALAQAKLAGKPDPGPKYVKKAEAANAEAKRQLEAQRLVLETRARELESAIDEHAPEMLQALTARQRELYPQLQDDLERFAGTYAELKQIATAAARMGGVGGTVPWIVHGLASPAGGPGYDIGTVLAALRRFSEPIEVVDVAIKAAHRPSSPIAPLGGLGPGAAVLTTLTTQLRDAIAEREIQTPEGLGYRFRQRASEPIEAALDRIDPRWREFIAIFYPQRRPAAA